MINIRYVLSIYGSTKNCTASRYVSRPCVPRIGEHFAYLDGWGAVRITNVFHSADSDEVECHMVIKNLQAEMDSLLEQLRAANWTVRE